MYGHFEPNAPVSLHLQKLCLELLFDIYLRSALYASKIFIILHIDKMK